MTKKTINVELDYFDFYNILELLGEQPGEQWKQMRDRFLERVFEVAAVEKRNRFDWIPIQEWNKEGFVQLRATEHGLLRKIQVIKDVRGLSGCGLREAKDYVDSLNPFNWREFEYVCEMNPAFTSWEVFRDDGGHTFEVRSVEGDVHRGMKLR